MKRWLLVIVLLLSLGLNLGWLGQRWYQQRKAANEAQMLEEITRPPEAPSGPGIDAGPGAPMPRLLQRMADQLKLEGESRREFLELQRSFLRRTFEARREVVQLQHQLRQEIVQADPDRQLIDQHLGAVNAAQLDLERDFVDHLFASRELLDPQQERRFLRMMARLKRGRMQGPDAGWRQGPRR